jgi:hypothetical protein
MSFAPENRFPSSDPAAPESLLNLPVGLASPLWGLFAGAAMTGAAWWWMTRWARPENLEAMFGAALEPEARTFAPAVAAATEPEKAGPVAGTVAEALTEAPLPAAPVGGEAAPISPVVEALAPEPPPEATAEATPKPRKKPGEAAAPGHPA